VLLLVFNIVHNVFINIFNMFKLFDQKMITMFEGIKDSNNITAIKVLSTLSSLSIKVPVLSLQRTSIQVISSIAAILLVIAHAKLPGEKSTPITYFHN
jgi:hypothetical protein